MTFESEKPLIKEILFPLCDDNGKKKFNKIQELTSRKIMGSTSDLAIGKAISSIIESRSKHQLRLSQISFLSSLLFLPLQPEVLSLPCSVTVGILRLHFSWVNTYLKITQIHVQLFKMAFTWAFSQTVCYCKIFHLLPVRPKLLKFD